MSLLYAFSSMTIFCLLLGITARKEKNAVVRMLLTKSASPSIAEAIGQKTSGILLCLRLVSIEKLTKDLRRAGWSFTAQEWLGLWFGVGLVGVLSASTLIVLTRETLPFALTLPLLSFGLPKTLLDQAVIRQKRVLEREFTNFVEKIAICVAANVPLVKTLTQHHDRTSPLNREIRLAVEEHNAGMPLEQALSRFAERIDTDTAQDFVASIVNALRYGSANLTELLQEQSRAIRRMREDAVEEIARKMETKLLIPVVLTVLPAAAILLLGPLGLYIVRALAP